MADNGFSETQMGRICIERRLLTPEELTKLKPLAWRRNFYE